MADQDFNIKVVTSADLSGINQTEAGLKRLSIDEANRLGRIASERRSSLREALTPVPAGLGGTASSLEEEMEKVGPSALFAGVNIAKARQEATFLVRELATGVPTTRTLSSLLGSLGPYLALAAGAGFALNRAIVANANRQVELTHELDIQLTKLTEVQQKWTAIGHAVTSPEDIVKLTSAIIPTLDEAGAKFREFQNAGISWVKELSDLFTAGIPGAGRIFANLFQEQSSRLVENQQRLRESASAAARVGEETLKAFDAKRVEPLSQAIDELTKKINEQRTLQKQVGTDNIESYNAIGRTIENYKNQLSAIIRLQAQERALAEASAKRLGLQTPTRQFTEDQNKAYAEHQAQRAALEQKRREAAASGDTARARAIEDELKDDKFNRDQRKEALQRYVANQESISGGPDATQSDRLKQLGTEGLRKYELANKELASIYGQQKTEQGKDYGSDILATLRMILDQWR